MSTVEQQNLCISSHAKLIYKEENKLNQACNRRKEEDRKGMREETKNFSALRTLFRLFSKRAYSSNTSRSSGDRGGGARSDDDGGAKGGGTGGCLSPVLLAPSCCC